MTFTKNTAMFLILFGLALVSTICVFPYILTLQAETIEKASVPIIALFGAQFAQSIVLFGIAISLGLFFARRTGFRLPLIEAVVSKGDSWRVFKSFAWLSLAAGIATALSIYAVDALFTMLGATLSTHQNFAPDWQKLLAAVYGGVSEEILMRLFLMTFLVWIGMKLSRKSTPSRAGIVIAILISSIIFGLGHLPLTASLTAITPLIVMRAIVLNGIGGIVFGFLYWKRGLESAMLAHFVTDIFLLTLLPHVFG